MYAVHHTEGVIISEYTKGETHKVFQMYTKEFGLIYLEGTSIRKNISKMRGCMQLFNLVNVSFVIGRHDKILTNAEVIYSPKTEIERIFISRILERVKRLVKGEEKNTFLFEEIELAYKLIKYENLNDKEFVRGFEYLFILKILNNLGYWAETEILNKLLDQPFYEASLWAYKNRELLVPQIKNSLIETGLY